jgi:hypothetical protein
VTPLLVIATTCRAGTCVQNEIGPDTSQARFYLTPILGQAYGESFVATDTLIESITIWRRVEEDTAFVGYELFIVGTDSLGRPDVQNKTLLQGMVAYNYYGDGIHPIPITFSFSPRFALPALGRYEFAIQLAPCTAVSSLLMSGDAYSDGEHWRHGESAIGGCYLRPDPLEIAGEDMIFTIAFCDQEVATKSETWGRTKARYR